MHQKCSNYALINLLFGLCRCVWIIDPLVTCPSPHFGASTRLSTLQVLRVRERTPTLYPFIIFTFGLVVESIKELVGASTKHEHHLVEFCPHDTLRFFGFRLHVTNYSGVKKTTNDSDWGWSCDPFTNKHFFNKNYPRSFGFCFLSKNMSSSSERFSMSIISKTFETSLGVKTLLIIVLTIWGQVGVVPMLG